MKNNEIKTQKLKNKISKVKIHLMGRDSGQDGGVSRYTLPPHTTKRTTNLKTKNYQNCQKIEPYGSLTTKELKKKYSSRRVEGWRWTAEVRGLAARWWLVNQVVPHLCVEKLGETTRE